MLYVFAATPTKRDYKFIIKKVKYVIPVNGYCKVDDSAIRELSRNEDLFMLPSGIEIKGDEVEVKPIPRVPRKSVVHIDEPNSETKRRKKAIATAIKGGKRATPRTVEQVRAIEKIEDEKKEVKNEPKVEKSIKKVVKKEDKKPIIKPMVFN